MLFGPISSGLIIPLREMCCVSLFTTTSRLPSITRFPLGILSITFAVRTAVRSLLLDVEPEPSCFSLVSAPTPPWDNLSVDMPKNADIEVDRLESFSVLVEAFLFPLELSTIRTVTTSPTLCAFKSPKRNPFCISSDQSDPSSAAYTGEKVITSNAIINKYFILTPYHHLTLTVPLSSTSPITSFLDCILVIRRR